MSTLFDTGIDKGADLDGPYRYTLWRRWGGYGHGVNWIMLNPSKADHEVDDPTIKRCIGFTRAWGYNGFVVTNLFAWRDSDPAGLLTAPDPIGPRNDEVILSQAKGASLVICAWGCHGSLNGRSKAVLRMLREAQIDLHCLALTAAADPGHPLYLPRTAVPQKLEVTT